MMGQQEKTYPYDEMLPGDPSMPQLKAAWDPEFMLDIFRRTLKPFRDIEYDILGCRLSRFRYRQGTRSIMLYEVTLREKITSVKRNLWVTGVTYPDDRANRLYHRVLSSNPWQTIPDSTLWVEPVSYIPELKMLIQVFPQDRFLPTLPLLISGPPPELERFLLGCFGSGNWRLVRYEVEPVRYRPFLGVSLRYKIKARDISTNIERTKCFYIKIYRQENVKQTFELLNNLYLKLSTKGRGFATIKPLACFDDLHALVFEAAPGRSLEQLILQGENVNPAVSKSAAALAEFHQSKVDLGLYRSVEGTLSRARRAGQFIQWACPDLIGKVDEILIKLEYCIKEVPPCPTHLDIKVDHIFIDHDKVVFIDLDSFALSDPVFDPASLLVRIEMLPNLSSIPKSRVDTVSRIFLEKYFSNVPNDWQERLSINYSCAALKAALYYIQHQEPSWRKRVSMIVNRAMDVLSGRAPGL